MNGIERIAAERRRQIGKEGWTADHDDEHVGGELAVAAACYAARAGQLDRDDPPDAWPWGDEWWKPNDDPIRDLERAGALIAAEIDRLLRIRRPKPSRNRG